MPVILAQAGALLVTTLGSMAMRLMTQSMLEWAIVHAAERLAARTATPEDDVWVAKMKATLAGREAADANQPKG